ncbi:MAG: hypothetical protein GF411_00025 [Candidatus Lokiarchaeota archaeon]|nr:hypothetical protein [Candidatus Lokiarchaeota archaeon]
MDIDVQRMIDSIAQYLETNSETIQNIIRVIHERTVVSIATLAEELGTEVYTLVYQLAGLKTIEFSTNNVYTMCSLSPRGTDMIA